MSQTLKKFLFTNFKNELSKSITQNELTINSIYNLTVKNDIIEPISGFSSLFEKVLSKKTYEEFYSNNASVLADTLQTAIYEYFDSNTSSYKTRIFTIRKNLYLYEYDYSLNMLVFSNISFSNTPFIFYKDNCLYFLSQNDVLITVENDAIYTRLKPPSLKDFYVFEDKLFYISSKEKFKIYHTEDCELFNLSQNLSDSYSLDLKPEDGEVLKLCFYKEKLYVIQQYKISRITISSTSIAITECLKINAKINKNTISSLDNYIVFCSDKEIFIFDGNNIKSVFKSLHPDIDLVEAIGTSFNDKYYLKSRILIDEYYEIVLIECDIESLTYQIYNIGEISNLTTIQTPNHYHLIALVYQDSRYSFVCLNYSVLAGKTKYLKFNKITFNSNNLKYLKTIKIQSCGNYKFTITCDFKSETFSTSDTNLIINSLSMIGHYFDFKIESESSFYIDSIYVETLESGGLYD